MSGVTRRKHVLKELWDDDYELPKEGQQIVRVVCSRGNNLHEVETANVEDEHFLVTMPNKFRKNVWVKRGDYILVEPIEEGDKVKAEICRILTPEHIKEYTKAGIWPERFAKKDNGQLNGMTRAAYVEEEEEGDSNTDSDDDLEPNMNRPIQKTIVESDDESDEDSDDSDEDRQ